MLFLIHFSTISFALIEIDEKYLLGNPNNFENEKINYKNLPIFNILINWFKLIKYLKLFL